MNKLIIYAILNVNLLLLFLASPSFAKKYNNKYLDSLFSKELSKEFKNDEVENLISLIVESDIPKKNDALIEFSRSSDFYRGYSITALIKIKEPRAAEVLDETKSKINSNDWIDILHLIFKKRDDYDNVYKIVVEQAMAHADENIRDVLLRFLYKKATFEETVIITKRLNTETSSSCRGWLYRTLARFNDEKTNSILKKLLQDYGEPDEINEVIEYAFTGYNRYDFLPDLYGLREFLSKEKRPSKIADAHETLKILEKVIPALENKKRKNAPIGLPLDWGKAKGK